MMELYGFRKSDVKRFMKVARSTAAATGSSVAYCLFDFLTSVIRYGVSTEQYTIGNFYKMPRYERKVAYTRQRRDRLRKLLNDSGYLHLFKNKEEFNGLFRAFIRRDWIDCHSATADDIAAFLRRNRRVIVKPGNSEKGHGIHFLEYGGKDPESVASSFAGTDTLLEEGLVQHPQMCIGNHSVNTLRMTTVLDAQGEAHVISTCFRCGVGDAEVDNFSVGGIVYPLDNELGRINGPALGHAQGQSIYVHPGTEIYMLGREIPFWNEALALAKAAAKVVPQVRLVGWDIAILETGPELIEGNTKPGEILVECQGEGKRGHYREMMALV